MDIFMMCEGGDAAVLTVFTAERNVDSYPEVPFPHSLTT